MDVEENLSYINIVTLQWRLNYDRKCEIYDYSECEKVMFHHATLWLLKNQSISWFLYEDYIIHKMKICTMKFFECVIKFYSTYDRWLYILRPSDNENELLFFYYGRRDWAL